LARQANAYITPLVRAAIPGVVETIRTLHAQGYELHMASGEPSYDLQGYLTGMGVRDCFGRLYGPDLIDTFKNGPEYYRRLLADMGIDPMQALIVDDSPLRSHGQVRLVPEQCWCAKKYLRKCKLRCVSIV
jgi:phosphoglycolate phosphatase-like HAD superfamily hydrolase